MKTIEVIISPQGEISLQTKGYTGSSCQQASQWLEEALGLKQKETFTSEYYQTHQTQKQTESQGG